MSDTLFVYFLCRCDEHGEFVVSEVREAQLPELSKKRERRAYYG